MLSGKSCIVNNISILTEIQAMQGLIHLSSSSVIKRSWHVLTYYRFSYSAEKDAYIVASFFLTITLITGLNGLKNEDNIRKMRKRHEILL